MDIDDVLCKWEESYCKYFNIECLSDHDDSLITYNVENILANNKSFWIGLPRKHRIDFYPELYCTKRCIPKAWTIAFLKLNNFPIRPIIQISQKDLKSKYIKDKVDIFIDDSIDNFREITGSGIKCFLMDSRSNKSFKTKYRIKTITKKSIITKYLRLYDQKQLLA